MKRVEQAAEVNIHLRARAQDKLIIDRAATLTGANRSQFMLSSAIKEAKRILLEQTSFVVDGRTFQAVLETLDQPVSDHVRAGMDRLRQVKSPWVDGR